MVGRIRVDPLSAITRVPLDADDLRDMAYSRARAAAAAAAAARARLLPRRRPSPCPSPSPGDNEGTNIDGNGVSAAGSGDMLALAGSAAAADASSVDGVNTNGCNSSEYGIAAFCLDSSCEVGRVALVFGGAPIAGCSGDDSHDSSSGLRGRDLGSSSNSKHRERSGGGKRASATQELSNPEVWLQDLSCR